MEVGLDGWGGEHGQMALIEEDGGMGHDGQVGVLHILVTSHHITSYHVNRLVS